MTLISRLLEFLAGALPSAEAALPEPDERLATAALLVHVAKVDGRLAEGEQARLVDLFRQRFGIGETEAEGLVARAESLEHEVGGLPALFERLDGEASEAERCRLLAAAYDVARSDGRIEEFENDLVWRVGRLLGFDDAAIGAVRDSGALPAAPPGARA